jgi:hypothetical protein
MPVGLVSASFIALAAATYFGRMTQKIISLTLTMIKIILANGVLASVIGCSYARKNDEYGNADRDNQRHLLSC